MSQEAQNILALLENDGFKANLMVFSLIMARIMTLVSLVPFLGSKNAPGPTKIGISLAIALLAYPIYTNSSNALISVNPLVYSMLLMKEIFIGFTIGFITNKMFYAVQISGQIIDMVRGANQIQAMVPETGERSSAIGTFNYQLLVALFLGLNFHFYFFEALFDSFRLLPVTEFFNASRTIPLVANEMMLMVAQIFRIGVSLAMPVIIVCLLIDVGFGLMNRVAPQINAYFLSLPAKAVGGIMIFFAAFNLLVSQFGEKSREMLGALHALIQQL